MAEPQKPSLWKLVVGTVGKISDLVRPRILVRPKKRAPDPLSLPAGWLTQTQTIPRRRLFVFSRPRKAELHLVLQTASEVVGGSMAFPFVPEGRRFLNCWPQGAGGNAADLMCQIVWGAEPVCIPDGCKQPLWIDAAKAAASVALFRARQQDVSAEQSSKSDHQVCKVVIFRGNVWERWRFRVILAANWPPRLSLESVERSQYSTGKDMADMDSVVAWLSTGEPAVAVVEPVVTWTVTQRREVVARIKQSRLPARASCLDSWNLLERFADHWRCYWEAGRVELPMAADCGLTLRLARTRWGAPTIHEEQIPTPSGCGAFVLRMPAGGGESQFQMESRDGAFPESALTFTAAASSLGAASGERCATVDICPATGSARLRLNEEAKTPGCAVTWPRVGPAQADSDVSQSGAGLVACIAVGPNAPREFWLRALLTMRCLLPRLRAVTLVAQDEREVWRGLTFTGPEFADWTDADVDKAVYRMQRFHQDGQHTLEPFDDLSSAVHGLLSPAIWRDAEADGAAVLLAASDDVKMSANSPWATLEDRWTWFIEAGGMVGRELSIFCAYWSDGGSGSAVASRLRELVLFGAQVRSVEELLSEWTLVDPREAETKARQDAKSLCQALDRRDGEGNELSLQDEWGTPFVGSPQSQRLERFSPYSWSSGREVFRKA